VAGDRKYGFRVRPGERFPRVMLHAWRTSFVHPITGATIAVTASPPEPALAPE